MKVCQNPYPLNYSRWQIEDRVVSESASDSKEYNIPVFDAFTNHNQALDVWDKAIGEGRMQKGGTLIHFDTHSDLYSSRRSTENFADYINKAIVDEMFSEVYWVLPDWTRTPSNTTIFWNFSKQLQTEVGAFLGSDKKEYSLYVNIINGVVFTNKPGDYYNNPKNYRMVKFHKITIDELPYFSGNNMVSVDVDSDYFSNTGFDTDGNRDYFPDPLKLRQELERFDRTLKQKGIFPKVVSLARSPGYTCFTDIPQIEDHFKSNYGQDYIDDANYEGSYPHARINYDPRHLSGHNNPLPKEVKENYIAAKAEGLHGQEIDAIIKFSLLK